jgi:hypothetical protein
MNKGRVAIAGLASVSGLILGFIFLKSEPEKIRLPGAAPSSKPIEAKADVSNNVPAKYAVVDPNERVRLALEKFKAEQAKIPEGAVAQQLAAVKERTAELAKIETPLPSISHETDENGMKWKRLAYPSGEVRYELSE